MKITPTPGPLPVQANTTNAPAQDARARAIAKLTAAPTQAPIPVNANNISPEEVSAVQAPQSASPSDKSPTTEAPQAAEPAQTPETPNKPAEDDSLSNKYQILARKERALRAKAQQQEQAWQSREQALKAREAELEAKSKTYDTEYIPRSQLKQAALDAVATGDIPYDEITEQILNQGKADPRVMKYIQSLESKVKNLEQGVEEQKNTWKNSQDEQYKAAVKQIETDVRSLVTTDPEYEAIRATKSVRDVVDLIEMKFKEDGTLLSVEDAAREVENYLVEEATKLAQLNKIQKRTQKQPAAGSKPPEPQQNKQPQPMKTLTNAAGSTRKLSSKERAILAFKNELKAWCASNKVYDRFIPLRGISLLQCMVYWIRLI